MGAGKTTLVQGLAEGLGVVGPVASPTYQLYHVHRGRDRQLVHLDAYRLAGPEEVEGLLLEETLTSPWLLVAEWPERLPTAWLSGARGLRLTPQEPQGRLLELVRW